MSINNKSSMERLETFIYNDNTLEHLHRYAFASTFVTDKYVLDIASGEGYGTNLLSKTAKKIYGVDIDDLVINNSKKKYQANNIEFIWGSCECIPLEDSIIDVVVSFETIEHHDKHHEMMLEIKRVLKPGGLLIMSTPEKMIYTEYESNINQYHIKELYLLELKELINSYFENSHYLFQNIFRGSLIIPSSNFTILDIIEGDFESINSIKKINYTYNIVIASDVKIDKDLNGSGFKSLIVNAKEKLQIEDEIKKSLSYRIGHLILFPFKQIKKYLCFNCY